MDRLLQQIMKKASLGGAFFYVLLQSVSASAACLQPDTGQLTRYAVEYVHDGDTVRTWSGEKVRLIGFNTTEVAREERPAEPLSDEATQRLRQLLGATPEIQLLPAAESRDRYGRLLAYGFTATGEDIAATLIGEGLAYPLIVPPNLWNSDCYLQQAAAAEQAGLGIWSHPALQVRPLSQIGRGGFQRIRGEVRGVDRSRKWLWIDLTDQVSLQIAKRDLSHFEPVIDLQQLKGRWITAQGWLVPRKRGYRMRLRHPSAIKLE